MTKSDRRALQRMGLEPEPNRGYFTAILVCALFIVALWFIGYGLLKRPVYLPEDASVVMEEK